VANPLHLTVLTPAETLIQAEQVKWVQVQLADGSGISIWPGHAPLLGETMTALLRYADDTSERTLDLEAGILLVDRNGVTIFTGGLAEPPADFEPGGGAARFERLAQTLLTALHEEPTEVLSAGDEDEA
jgi:F0F1-type ATP synthase epsilon subunit